MKQSEIRINSPEEEINYNSLENLENYTEIIPQKIEKEKGKEKENMNINIATGEENIFDSNLEFSFGKDLKKHLETNRLKTDLNYNNYQMTDSVSNILENEDGNKKMKIIKEKFISNFKSKDRNESLEKAFTLFEKFNNNLNNNKIGLPNLSFSQKFERPFKFLTSQSTNSLSIIDKIKDTHNKLAHNNTLNTIKSNEDFFKYKIKKISKIIKEKEKEEENDENNNINKNNETTYIKSRKNNNKKIFSLKDETKKGFFIRKVIREEKYLIDDDGTEKLIGIRQSTFDIKNNKKKDKKINVNKIRKDNNNKTLLNKKKFAEYIKDRITNRKSEGSLCFQNKNTNKDNNIKNIEINTEFINNKNINNDNCNNIKIVINKINKINSNPKINLNFIKKYKNGIKSLENIENKENIQNNNDNNKENKICETEINQHDNKVHIIKVGKIINKSKIQSDILNNYNMCNQLGKYHRKIKMNLPPIGKLKLIKCEKINSNNNKIPLTLLKKCDKNRPSIKKRDLTKRNYSFKEIRNLSKNSQSNTKYIFSRHSERNDLEKNKNLKNIKIESYIANISNDNLKFKKYLIDSFNKKNRFNHNFYESKSFSIQNKENIQSQNLITDCHTPNTNRNIFFKYTINPKGNEGKKNNSGLSIANANSNNYNINTSFSGIFRYNNTLN